MARQYKGPYLRQRGASWILHYQNPQGERSRRSLGGICQSDAESCLAVAELEWKLGRELSLPELQRIYGDTSGEMRGFVETRYLPWRAQAFPSSQARAEQMARQHLLPVFGDAPMDGISAGDVTDYKAHRKRAGAADGTIKKELDLLGAILKQAHQWGDLDELRVFPGRMIKVRDGKAPVFYSGAELEQLYQWSPYHGPIWMLFSNTGLRRAEALKARRSDIRNGNQLYIESNPGKERTKSQKWRIVPINKGAGLALNHLGDDRLLPKMTPQSLTRAFDKCRKRADLPGSLHTLRHSFCSHLVMAGVPIRTVQQLAGHENIKTTERYAHLAPDYMAQSVERINL